jgi:signal transduction histidine kinase
VLTDHGLASALEYLAERAPLPVTVKAAPDRHSAALEATAYYVAAEALTNVAKYARASRASVVVARTTGWLTIEVSDDGVGGADASRGSGLRGLGDRVAALDGCLEVESPPGGGTRVFATLPCD